MAGELTQEDCSHESPAKVPTPYRDAWDLPKTILMKRIGYLAPFLLATQSVWALNPHPPHLADLYLARDVNRQEECQYGRLGGVQGQRRFL